MSISSKNSVLETNMRVTYFSRIRLSIVMNADTRASRFTFSFWNRGLFMMKHGSGESGD
jgi:hypothetical protein